MPTPETPRYSVDISVSIRDVSYAGGSLRIEENVTIPAGDFFSLAKILGQFHEVAQALKSENDA